MAPAAHAQVYRCEVNGKVTLTDTPCASGGRIVVVPNQRPVLNSAPPAPLAAPSRQVRSSTTITTTTSESSTSGVRAPVSEPGACPSDTDIANIHTRLSARVVPADNRVALQHELAKAQQCRAVGIRYSYDDWRRLEAVLRGDH
jgi:hypothetical protein